MQIIRMTKQEVPEVAELEKLIFSMPWSPQGFYDTLVMDNVIFLTAVEDGRVCGYCGIYLAADEGEITNVAVAPEFRRRGIALELVQELIRQAGLRGTVSFVLEVRASNKGAISLYKQLGFVSSGIRRNFYQRPDEDACIMMLHH